ncbi:Nif3-like dinuclear metal center hexameric protein [uncultured Gemmiger sp.]|uniref:Nif3-like dinuclear metal center hexameric protein n=1 Tax=uncultured Gemmiger sp. TaxID=1623490 RepID=UPI00266CCB10|nr:Nif3-like dinuclear metal center hexameric protein [uncultured Gemmiger sp.]
MSVTVQQILGLLQAVAPPALALDWDNVGLLVDAGTPVDSVLTTLDITPAVVREAVENDCQLIVSHHPVIFHPIKSLHADDVPALLMKNGISAICMHTNLDAAPGGVNDTLCDILGIAAEGRESFAEGCGRIGTTMPTTVEALAKFCADTLHSGVKYVNGQKPVTCLAEVSGGGGSYLQEAIDLGADCLVTGEAAHHIALLAKEKGVGLVVAGHWGTEHAVADVLAAHITKQFPQLTVAHAEADKDPYSYLL